MVEPDQRNVSVKSLGCVAHRNIFMSLGGGRRVVFAIS
jgi:hypothetical protein